MNYITMLANGDTLKFCESHNVLTIFYFIKQMIRLVSVLVPVILIIMILLDVFKVVASGNVDDEFKKMGGKVVKRLIFCFVFFVLPVILNFVSQLIGMVNYDASKCWQDATEEVIKQKKQEHDYNSQINQEQNNNSQTEQEQNNDFQLNQGNSIGNVEN